MHNNNIKSRFCRSWQKHLPLIGLCLLSPALQAQPTAPDALVMVLGAEPDAGFDPLTGWGRYNNPLIQSALLKRSSEGQFIGDLAESWQLSDDKLSWQISLRPNLVFSNKTSLDATDVAFTFNYAMTHASVQDMSALKEVEIVSPQKLIFHLKQPNLGFINAFAELSIVPSDSYSPKYGQNPVGSGPYRFVRWDKGQQLVLEANPYYQSADESNRLLKTPFFKKIIAVFANEDSRFGLLKTGQLQLAALAPRYAKAAETQQYKLWQLPSVDDRGIVWPMQAEHNAVTADPAVRKAFSLLVDRLLLSNALLDGYASPAWSVGDNLPWGGATPTWAQLPMELRLKQAAKILDDAGWKLAKDGIRYKNGTELTFPIYYYASDSIRKQLVIASAEMAKPLGFVVIPKGDSWENINKLLPRVPVLFGFGSLAFSELNLIHVSTYAGQGYNNPGYYKNAEVDRLLTQATHADSIENAIPFWQQAQAQIAQDQPITWLVNLTHLYATHPCLDLGNPLIEPHGHGWPVVNNINEWQWQCQ